MKSKKLHVVQVGETHGFPVGMAAIEKIRLIGIALLSANVDVTVISKKGCFYPDEGIDFPPSGNHQGIEYVYTAGSIYRPEGFIKRNLKKIDGWLKEISLLWKYKRAGRLDAAIVHSMEFSDIFIYRILSIVLGFKFLYPYVELNSSLPQRNNFLERTQDYLLENIGLRMPDALLPISNHLIDFLNIKGVKKPILKVPIIAEFSRFEIPKERNEDKYFLYCGAAEYSAVIHFILEVFEQLDNKDHYLYLVVGGQDESKELIKARIAESPVSERIKFFTKLPYDNLVQKYLNAKALLIPLRFNIQDSARFPHKIGEYLASGNPMISTNVGEVQHYFTDGENALISDSYDPQAYKEKMQFVIDEPEKAREIGANGKAFGKATFDFPVFGKEIKSLILSI